MSAPSVLQEAWLSLAKQCWFAIYLTCALSLVWEHSWVGSTWSIFLFLCLKRQITVQMKRTKSDRWNLHAGWSSRQQIGALEKIRGRIRKFIPCTTRNAELTVEQPWAQASVGRCCVQTQKNCHLKTLFCLVASRAVAKVNLLIKKARIYFLLMAMIQIKFIVDSTKCISQQIFTIGRALFVTHVDSKMW